MTLLRLKDNGVGFALVKEQGAAVLSTPVLTRVCPLESGGHIVSG